MIPFYSLVPVFGISISEQPKIYFNHRNTLISLLSNTLIVNWLESQLQRNEGIKIDTIAIARRLNFDYSICIKNRSSIVHPVSIFLRLA